MGFLSADAEEARTIIITTLAVLHKNLIIVSDEYYVRIPFNVYFSAIRLMHFGEVMARFRITLTNSILVPNCIKFLCALPVALRRTPPPRAAIQAPIH